MLKLKNLQEGDYVFAEFEGEKLEGVVRELHRDDDDSVLIETVKQAYWYTPEHISPIPLDEAQLMKLGFEKQENDDLSVKYMRGPFRVYLPVKGDFSDMEIWYREDHRLLSQPISVNELQHHFSQMTKIPLTRPEKIGAE